MLVAKVWLLSRAVMALVGAIVMVTDHVDVATVLRRWDVVHFTAIAVDGYSDPTSAAFFPGLPLLLHAGRAIGLPMELTGVLVSLAGSALAAAALYRLFGAPAACLWLVAPTAVFTFVGYSEAAFCAAAFWAWQRARSDRWGQAAALAGVACAFRVSGLFLIGALGLLALSRAPAARRWAALAKRWAWLLVPVGVLTAYEVYLYLMTGTWTAWFQAEQSGWTRGVVNPWASLRHTLDAGRLSQWPGRPDVAWVFRAEVVSMAVGLGATIWCAIRRRWPEAAFIGVQVIAFGTSWWYMSVNRAVLLWFPLWATLGAAVAWQPTRHKVAKNVLVALAIAVEAAAMVVWAWLFFTGRWAS